MSSITNLADITAPVVKEVTVPRGAETAWRVFVERIGEWWPLASHSVGRKDSVTCAFEPGPGGRLHERTADGAEHVWGRITDWDPPRRLAFTWHPGLDEREATRVAVTFEPLEGGATRVRLEHSGWSARGDRAAEVRGQYDAGWGVVFGELYAKAVG